MLLTRIVYLFSLFLCASFVLPCPARSEKLYGYEDEYGIVHLSDKQASEDYVFLVNDPKKKKLSFLDIKKIIKNAGAVKKNRKESWIKSNITKYKRKKWSASGYPKRIKSGKIITYIQQASKKYKLDPNLVYSVIEQESNFQNNAVSPKGAMGMMQLMPETTRHFGLETPFDPRKNIETGARYLRMLLNKFSSLPLALAAYNAGPENVKKYRGIPPFPETQHYVSRIMRRYSMLKGM